MFFKLLTRAPLITIDELVFDLLLFFKNSFSLIYKMSKKYVNENENKEYVFLHFQIRELHGNKKNDIG